MTVYLFHWIFRVVILPLLKESLNIDGHQFHQCKKKTQSPLILTELTEHKKPQHITLGIQAVDWERAAFVDSLKYKTNRSFICN
jgi:hypothetical protein